MFVVLILHQDTNLVCLTLLGVDVCLPVYRKEKRTGRVHDSDVWKKVLLVVRLQRLDHMKEEGMLRDGAHGVVGNTGGCGASDPGTV